MEVTELGMLKGPVKPVFLNMFAGILCTSFPMESVPEKPSNGEFPYSTSSQLTALKAKLLKLLQPEKAFIPIEVTDLPIVKEPVKPLQSLNAHSPIAVTELPIDRLPVKPIHPSKAYSPIVVTELGIVNEPVKPTHPLNAYSPIAVKELGKTTGLAILLS